MVLATNLGYPRIGPKRELKKSVESYWAGESGTTELENTCRRLRRDHWILQKNAGLNHVPSNDFSLYDHVLDAAAMVGAVPSRYHWEGDKVHRHVYFAMARGVQDAPAMEMTKWFDTNYHYIVPEFEPGQTFQLADDKPVREFIEAKESGVRTRPVLLGPVSFLLLGKPTDPAVEPLKLLDALLPVYEDVLNRLRQAGAQWVQIDEPCLVLDLDDPARVAYRNAYERLGTVSDDLKILIATYFGGLRDNLSTALSLPVAALHLDRVRGDDPLEKVLEQMPDSMSLSLGVVSGRNVWRTDLERALGQVEQAAKALGSDRVLVGPSCSLLHSPVDLELEDSLEPELYEWLAFARQKIDEIAVIAEAVNEGRKAVGPQLHSNREAIARRRTSERIHNPAVKERIARIDEALMRRRSPYPERRPQQSARLELPPLPTTTIGSFPQTREIRAARAAARKGEKTAEEYESFLREKTEEAIRFQEDVGIDVLVHGEFERNDMVEYFGEKLNGFEFTRFGWVQSYGSRCVKPPIIFGDVSRPEPMTVDWSTFAQSLTDKPVKGMLTGPVTILQWSFVRDDQPRRDTCFQIALSIRDEVADLETTGIKVIQIDEPALREGLPLRRSDWETYLDWAVKAFRISSSGVEDETQIHTHMCYSEFNDIIQAIAAMDADVISIEASRSKMDLLSAFARFKYPNEIGPGVYDIHSPRIPSREEMEDLLRAALEVLSVEQLWVNPDCGLKTRRWEEVKPALKAMVEAARNVRATVSA